MKGTTQALVLSLALLGSSMACSQAPVSGSAPGGGAAAGGSGGTAFVADVRARCGANQTRDACNAENLPYENTFCVWIDWVQIQDADACGLGDVRGVCSWDAGHDACGSLQDAVRECSDDELRFLVRRETADGVEIGRAGGCNEASTLRDGGELCSYDSNLGESTDPAAWNYPECACHCAAELPIEE